MGYGFKRRRDLCCWRIAKGVQLEVLRRRIVRASAPTSDSALAKSKRACASRSRLRGLGPAAKKKLMPLGFELAQDGDAEGMLLFAP